MAPRSRRLLAPTAALLLVATLVGSLHAQTLVDTYRPRIAVAADGSYAVAFDALIEDITTAWQVAVQRYAPDGTPVGPTNLFEGESCSTVDIWTADTNRRADLAFQSDGTLLVAMTHEGELSIIVDGVFTAESTLGAIDTNGQIIDLNSAGGCVQRKLIFPGGDTQKLPRIAIGPDDAIYFVHRGMFDDAFFVNIGMRILDGGGNELVNLLIPHDDPRSQASFHTAPDIAVSATTLATVWHECVLTDNEGNSNDCDIGAQFYDISGGLASATTLGLNQKVNATGVGVPETYSLYPAVTMNAAGQSVVAWLDLLTTETANVFAQAYATNGQPVGGNVQVNVDPVLVDLNNDDGRPEVAMLPDGTYRVVWTSTAEVARGRTFTFEGQPLTDPQDLAGPVSGLPDIDVAGTGFITAWLTVSAREGGISGIGVSTLGLIVDTESAESLPDGGLHLDAAYPNPFTSTTTLRYTLPASGHADIRVYDLLGREVQQLGDTFQHAGTHAVMLDGTDLALGVYLVRVRHGDFHATQVVVRK